MYFIYQNTIFITTKYFTFYIFRLCYILVLFTVTATQNKKKKATRWLSINPHKTSDIHTSHSSAKHHISTASKRSTIPTLIFHWSLQHYHFPVNNSSLVNSSAHKCTVNQSYFHLQVTYSHIHCQNLFVKKYLKKISLDLCIMWSKISHLMQYLRSF